MLYIAYLKHLKPEKHKLYLISKVYHRISNVHCNQILLRKKVEVYDKGWNSLYKIIGIKS